MCERGSKTVWQYNHWKGKDEPMQGSIYDDKEKKICSECGKAVENPESKYCSMCGEKY